MPLPPHRSTVDAKLLTPKEFLDHLKEHGFGHDKNILSDRFAEPRWFNPVDGNILISTEQVLIDSMELEARTCLIQPSNNESVPPAATAETDEASFEMGKPQSRISFLKGGSRKILLTPLGKCDSLPLEGFVEVAIYVPGCTADDTLSAFLPMKGCLDDLGLLEYSLAGFLARSLHARQYHFKLAPNEVWKYQLLSRSLKCMMTRASIKLEVENDYRKFIVAISRSDNAPLAILTKASWAIGSPRLSGKAHAPDETSGTDTTILRQGSAMEPYSEDDPLAGNAYGEDGTPFFDQKVLSAEWLEKWLSKKNSEDRVASLDL